MKPYFVYKGINSREMGISILKLPPRIKPERRGEIINVPGRDGFLFESDNAYNGKTLEIECTFIPPERYSQSGIDKLIMDILVWLDSNGDLVFSDYPDYYYEAKIINAIPIERLFKRYRRFLIAFEVQPFAKKLVQSIVTKNTLAEETISVDTYYETPIKINLEATGSVDININDTTMHFDNLEVPIIIDGELEPSFPSSHTMLAICTCVSSLMVYKKYVPSKFNYLVLFSTVLLLTLVFLGRTISGVHWISDILGGVIISLTLLTYFYTIIKWKKTE